MQQLHIAFPKDKPTFDIQYLDPSPAINSNIDDDWLLEKANAIKNKLQEFDIEVDIDGVNV
ncbi:MAG: hypothetical protein H6765_07150 [Candidatus Peribacteria bacterium]|nr:MAG: hypothetical protein H6765_07150 [Candidatus Peribacteria bacterium]